MASTDKKTIDQIVAEARKRFIQERDCALTPNDERIFDECIKSAVEKALKASGKWDVETWKNNFDLAVKKIHELESRAAHASEPTHKFPNF